MAKDSKDALVDESALEEEDVDAPISILNDFLSDIRDSDAFDLADQGAIEAAIVSYQERHAAERQINRILETRVRTLQRWGDQLDFTHTHRDLGQYFLQKHAKLIKAAGASDA